MNITSLRLERVGQIRNADVTFGDVTVLVGAQASGKSIVLHFLKLVADTGYVHDVLRRHGIDWKRSLKSFLDVYLGEGLRGLWHDGESHSALAVSGKPVEAEDLARPLHRSNKSSVFYIPAQRVFSLANGWPRPF